MKNRATRRDEMIKARNRAKEVIAVWQARCGPSLTGERPVVPHERVCRMAEVHCRPCNCPSCSPRKHGLAREKVSMEKADIAYAEQLREAR